MRWLWAVLGCLAVAGSTDAAGIQPSVTRPLRNLFSEYLGKSDAEIDAKLNAAWQQLFYGDDRDQRVYYPVGPDQAYIADTGNDDVRTEGMSYGMMIAVQTNHREEFNRLWKWTKTHMYQARGPMRGYFAWHCNYDGEQLSDGPAPDGEEWFAMALLFAANRWKSGEGIFDYHREANAILQVVLHKNDQQPPPPTTLFNLKEHQVVFVPTGPGATFTDPSYHLPAYYTLWSRWADADREFWKTAAQTSRAYFQRAAHPKTGLMPDYSNFDGTPRALGEHGDFRFDAWRTIANVSLDYAWFQADPWQVDQSNRVLRFLASQGKAFPNQYTLDGQPLSSEWSAGLAAMAAVGALTADKELGRPFVEQLWSLDIPHGHYRYYDGLLYFLALLEVSGRFQAYGPQ